MSDMHSTPMPLRAGGDALSGDSGGGVTGRVELGAFGAKDLSSPSDGGLSSATEVGVSSREAAIARLVQHMAEIQASAPRDVAPQGSGVLTGKSHEAEVFETLRSQIRDQFGIPHSERGDNAIGALAKRVGDHAVGAAERFSSVLAAGALAKQVGDYAVGAAEHFGSVVADDVKELGAFLAQPPHAPAAEIAKSLHGGVRSGVVTGEGHEAEVFEALRSQIRDQFGIPHSERGGSAIGALAKQVGDYAVGAGERFGTVVAQDVKEFSAFLAQPPYVPAAQIAKSLHEGVIEYMTKDAYENNRELVVGVQHAVSAAVEDPASAGAHAVTILSVGAMVHGPEMGEAPLAAQPAEALLRSKVESGLGAETVQGAEAMVETKPAITGGLGGSTNMEVAEHEGSGAQELVEIEKARQPEMDVKTRAEGHSLPMGAKEEISKASPDKDTHQIAEITIRESAGADVWAGEYHTDTSSGTQYPIMGRSRTPSSHATSTYANKGESLAYHEALNRGEIGLQRPAGANVAGVDFITAIVDPETQQVEVVVTDVKSSLRGRFPNPKESVPGTWQSELQDAVSAKRLQLGDQTLEKAIQDAVHNGRVRLRQLEVDFSTTGQGRIGGF